MTPLKAVNKTAYQFVEGGRWSPSLGKFLFTDAFLDTIYQATPTGTVDVFRQPAGRAANLDLDPAGSLIAAETSGRVSRTTAGGAVVDAVSSYRGLKLQGPDDVVVLKDGTMYVTDTDASRLMRIDPKGVLYYAVDSGDAGANGLALSPDEKILYVSYPAEATVRAFDLPTPDRPTNPRLFTKVKLGDGGVAGLGGLCVDREGNVFAATLVGLQVFDRAGKPWGTIELPVSNVANLRPRVANCAFGDADAQSLYVMGGGFLYRARMAKPGMY
jgi:gluconolactonase